MVLFNDLENINSLYNLLVTQLVCAEKYECIFESIEICMYVECGF
jgi:hypothetical protein